MLPIKPLLISTTALSAAVALTFYFPLIAKFAVYQLPYIYNAVASWLRPPYLYLLLNGIIITIVASSKLQRADDDVKTAPPVEVKEYPIAETLNSEVYESLHTTKIEPEELPVHEKSGPRGNSKNSPEGDGGELRIGQRKETVERVGKSTTEKGPVQASRQLRKWETWERKGGRAVSGKTMRASQSQEDLNRRVEEFISKFNQEIRQQQSANQ